MRTIIVFIAFTALIGYACDASTEEVPASPSPTSTEPPASLSPSPSVTASPAPTFPPAPSPFPTLRPTPTPLFSDFEDFKEFAVEIDAAAKVRDTGFFVERAVEASVTCPGNQEFGPCAYRENGVVVTGVPSAALGSAASGFLPLDEFTARLETGFLAAIADESDDLGSGVPRLHAVAWREESQRAYAVLREILDRGSEIGGEPSVGRQIRVFYFDLLDGDWALKGELTSRTATIAPEWGLGGCSQCYDVWELWEATD